jgi:DNA adenine methylase
MKTKFRTIKAANGTPKLTPPLKWHGGKDKLARRFIELMPPRCKNPNKPSPDDKGWLHYVEPYAGGLAVLLAQDPEGISEVVNDMNGDLTNFWRVMQREPQFGMMKEFLDCVPVSEPEFLKAGPAYFVEESADVLRAVNFFIRCRQSLSGRMKGFAGITRNRTRKGMNEQVSAWLNAIEGLPAAHARLMRVLIRDKPAVEIIKSEDGPRTLFFLDPPYLHETRATTTEYGEHEMSESDHRALLNVLGCLKGRFMLSGYRSDLYDERARMHGWNRHDFDVDNKASGGKTKRRMTECLWCNF